MLVLLCLASYAAAQRAHSLTRNYQGSTFFDSLYFQTGYNDTTTNNGDVQYVDKLNATQRGLTFINEKGHAVIKVDDKSEVLWDNKRDSVRVESTEYFPIGSLFVLDAIHIPYGCSVWPSWWTRAEVWPDQGEIDIVEGVNRAPNNQYALHTTPGCTTAPGTNQLGTTLESNCSAAGNVGCSTQETKPNSIGENFANAGGGVFAAQFDEAGIYTWLWSRPDVPASLRQEANVPVNMADFGPPSAAYPASTCDVAKFFGPQRIILGITLCGDWGNPSYFETCAGTGPTLESELPLKRACYLDNVIGSGANYASAFWEIAWMRVYNSGNSETIPVTFSSSQSATLSTAGTTPGPSASGGTQAPVNRDDNKSAAIGVVSKFRLESVMILVVVFALHNVL